MVFGYFGRFQMALLLIRDTGPFKWIKHANKYKDEDGGVWGITKKKKNIGIRFTGEMMAELYGSAMLEMGYYI